MKPEPIRGAKDKFRMMVGSPMVFTIIRYFSGDPGFILYKIRAKRLLHGPISFSNLFRGSETRNFGRQGQRPPKYCSRNGSVLTVWTDQVGQERPFEDYFSRIRWKNS